MRKTIAVILISLILASYMWAQADTGKKEVRQVMPAKKRAQIVATAKSIFEPEVKNSVKIGRVKSPFSSSSQ